MEHKGSKRKRKEAKEHKANWHEYVATIEDIEQFLDERVMLRRNVVTGLVEASPDWLPVSDFLLNSWWKELRRTKLVSLADVDHVVNSDYAPEYHPFRFYLEHLPPWNGEDYILGMSVGVTVKGGPEDQYKFYEFLRKWLVGMVAAWVDETAVNHEILVLVGRQGAYKTTWFSYLLPPELRRYFRIKTNAGRMNKDDLLALTRYGLVCCEELDTMNATAMNQLKSAMTMPAVDERPVYGRHHEHRPHIASFCGTGNNTQFLNDPTGTRRWLPFEVESIDSPREHPFDYEGIYAQAYALYNEGFQYWLSPAETEWLEQHNSTFETPKSEIDMVNWFFRKPMDNEMGEFMPVSVAMQIIAGNTAQIFTLEGLGRAFSKLGFRKKSDGEQRGYIVVRRSGAEIDERKHLLAVPEDLQF